MKKLIFFLFVILISFGLKAQVEVQGIVIEQSTSEPIIGATIMIKGSSKGTVTDMEGRYFLDSDEGDTLQVSYLGFGTRDVLVKEAALNGVISLSSDGLALEEVVVTALGVKREKRALTYAASELDASEINQVIQINPPNSFAGKVPGLQVTASSNGLASSSRLVLRGESSLRLGGNEPLIVLDGVPMNNSIFGVGGGVTDQLDPATDYGNGLSELNPNDFDKVSVLRGAAASALYGSRAANGVIVINTKKGNAKDEGIGVEVNSSLQVSQRLDLLDIQSEYGGGWAGDYASNFGTNFGPRFDGSIVRQEVSLQQFVDAPFENRYDLDDFFQTGTQQYHNVALSGANESGDFRFSYGLSDNEGIIPNTNLDGNSIRLNAGYHLTDRWQVNTYANYVKRESDNLPVTNYGSQALMYVLLWNYLNVDLKELQDYWIVEDQEQRRLFSWGENPWFIVNENINGFEKNRILGNVSTTYQFSDHFSVLGRIGLDQFDESRRSRRSVGSQRFPNGMYREQNVKFTEINADFLLTYENTFNDFDLRVAAGGNRFDQALSEDLLQGNGLEVPGLYNAQNINVTPLLRNDLFEKRINSLYGFANLGFKDYLYLDITARNDWSSTLPLDNNSFFYPSASLSFLISEVWAMPRGIDFFKLRANVAQVGNDTDPYRLVNTYDFGTLGGTLTNPTQLLNSSLKPERTTSTEVGFETYMFDKRLTIDATYYRSISKDQILNVGISNAGGFGSRLTNAGEIQNTGLEIATSITPIRTADFQWLVSANFSTNRSEVVSLSEGLETFIIGIGPNDVTIEARPGNKMGDIYGQTYLRDDNGSIVYQNGLPITAPDKKKVGNYNPDWMLGLSSGLGYKNFHLYAQFDIREGGEIYSYTNAIGRESGTLSFTLPWRDGIVGEGVMLDDEGQYIPNTVQVSAEDWAYAVPRSNAEANIFDASYIKLRQLSLSYSFAQNILDKIGFQGLTLSLTGSNLFLWTDVPNIDPESQAISGGTLLPGLEITQLPSTRQFGFNVNIKI